MDGYLNGNGGNQDDDNTTSTGVTYVDTVPIPEGFYYAGGSKDTGLVISNNEADKKEFSDATKTQSVPNTLQGNQFVWVPVDNPDALFTTSETGVQLTRVDTTTNVYSNLTVRSGDASYYTASNPGDTTSKSVREPDVLSSYDTNVQFYKWTLGFESTKAMADSLVAEYKAMSDSIKKYKGFYIGRYELTGSVDSPTEKKGASLTSQDWYNLYKACQNVIKGKENVKSTMIYGVQWDAVCSWLKQSEFDTDSNSSSWGNYSDSTGNAYIEGKSGLEQDTGFSEYWKANNIYDLAGNFREWTQEANSTRYRVNRRWFIQKFRFCRSSFTTLCSGFKQFVHHRLQFFSCHTLYRVVL